MNNNDQHSTRNTGRQTSRKSGSNSPNQHNPELKPSKDSDEVLGAIEGVEKQLEALRGAHEEHRKINAELAARREQIEEASEQVEVRESELSSREVELAEMRQELEDREAEIVQRASGLEQRESQMAQHAESIEELEAVVDTKSKQIDERVAELDKQLEGISIRKEELVKLEQKAKERIEQDDLLQVKIDQISKELAQTKATLGGREVELKERARAVEELAIQTGLLETQLEEMAAKAKAEEDESLKLIDEMQSKLDETQLKLESHDEAMQRALNRIDDIESVSKTREQELIKAKETIAKLSSLEQEHADSSQRIEQLEAKLADTQSKYDQAVKSLDGAPSTDDLQSMQSKLDQTTEQLNTARAAAEELQAQIKSIGTDASEELESANAKIQTLTTELQTTQSKLDETIADRDQSKSELESKLQKALESGQNLKDASGSTQAELQKLQDELDSREKQIQTIRDKYDEISNELSAQQKSSEETESQIKRLGELLDASAAKEQSLTEQVNELTEHIVTLESSGPEVVVVSSDDWTKSRKERLDRVKSILRQQSDKVRRATEALRDRYDQCEKVLLKRSELVEAYQAVADAQAKLAKREARSGTLLGLSGLGLVLMMIAGVSWFVAGQVAPGEYASRVTLVAQAGERTLSPEDIQSWQGYIESMISDPQFVEQAASRMKRRGIQELAIAGTLGAHMDQSLDLISAEPGKVEIEYRGQGPAKTQRVLDTIALTITSQANGSRARRIDGALTSMSEQASVGESPLDTVRVETAGMIFGGSSFATLAFGGIFWRRMAKLKANFERDSRVEPLFDEDSWEVEGKDA